LPPSDSLLSKVRAFWSALGDGATVVAVSGGADSVALLRALLAVGSGPLVVAHLNHQLRGADSDGDEAFVRELYASLRAAGFLSLELRCERIDVAARARVEQDNLENTARQVRYAWLTRIARECGAARVATGHTADDQAETVLHRLLRGAGLKGLGGIPARRPLTAGVEVVRPLLRVRRVEVLAFLEGAGQAYRQDRSNDDLDLTRNRLRHELLPHLAGQYNPAIVSVLCRLAGQAQELYRDVEERARDLLGASELPRAGALLVFDRRRLASASRPLLRDMFRLTWEREGWPMGGLDFDAWERLAAVAAGELPAADLPGGIRARCRENVIQVGRW
jgi:tRNA(Ile)-lysidine synthase